MESKKSIVYLNKPINSEKNDIIDFSTYVEKLDAAINEGAQMIGVVAPFGSGKSSMIGMLEEYRQNTNDKFIKISMWSQGLKPFCLEKDSIEFHKSFLYQMASQIDPKEGTYVSRRLSKNFGLLKIYLKNSKSKFLAIFLVFLMAIALCTNSFLFFFPYLESVIGSLKTITIISSVLISFLLLIESDAVFSSNKSEGSRNIEADEIMDLYRSIILKSQTSVIEKDIKDIPFRKGKNINKNKKKKTCSKYIVVIEDLDRSTNTKGVISFLKEIRKYYVPDSIKGDFQIDVVFIINVKPEAVLDNKKKNLDLVLNKSESLYAKLFDYTLNLQTINIDNYEVILKGLLEEKRGQLIDLKLVKEDGAVLKIPGVHWIIRERKIGIREIKERLNIALTLYESLIKKFGENKFIAFEKCAVSSYLTTAFEDDFYKTGDRAFDLMIEHYLKYGTNVPYNDILPNVSEEYVKVVVSLIDAKLIDNSYRMYFYNYPKESQLYTVEESQLIKAVLYNEKISSDIENIVNTIEKSKSNVINYCLTKLDDLQLSYPKILLETEQLYKHAVSWNFSKVLEYINKLDYSDENILQTISYLKRLMCFDREREVLSPIHIDKYCECWSSNFNENSLLKLRNMLCDNFSEEIYNYVRLFFGEHTLITYKEIDLISFNNAIKLTNIYSPEYGTSILDKLMEKFISLDFEIRVFLSKEFEEFLRNSVEVLGAEKMAHYLLCYMQKINQIIPDFELYVIEAINNDSINEEYEDE